MRVCLLHYQLQSQNPYSIPTPIHAVLGLDPEAKPFNPPSLSATSHGMLYDAVHQAIVAAFHEKTGHTVERMADGLDEDDTHTADSDRDAVYTSLAVVSLLSDDAVRGHYANHFVPALSSKGGDTLRTDDKIRVNRQLALERLCA